MKVRQLMGKNVVKKEYHFTEIKKKSLLIIFIMLVFYLTIGTVISTSYTLITGQALNEIQSNVFLWAIDLVTTAVLLFSLWYFIAGSFKDLKEKGFANLIKWIVLGFLFQLLMATAGYTLMAIIVFVGKIHLSLSNQTAVSELAKRFVLINFIDVVIIGPFIEELFFRVFVFGLLKHKKLILSIVLSALLFGLAHVMRELIQGEIVSALVTMIMYSFSGAALAILYAKRKNFMIPLIVHSLWNLMGFSLSLLRGFLS